MTDRELLELAAKAAGYAVKEDRPGRLFLPHPTDRAFLGPEWNPLADDGDALRLAVRLKINTRYCWDGCHDQYDEVWAERGRHYAVEQIGMFNYEELDENAATRRAIVRAAAEIAQAHPQGEVAAQEQEKPE